MKVIFYGTPEFAVPTLDALRDAGHDIVLVVAQPDKPAGRGQAVVSPPVAQRAKDLGLALAQPKAIRSGPFPERVLGLQADVGVVIAYGRILTRALLDAPRYGCVNVHASLLPRWRGAAPIQRAILAGDTETGVCTQRMEEGLDTGPLYLSHPTPIGPRETAGALHDRLSQMAAVIAAETLAILPSAAPVPQAEAGVTWAEKLGRDEARIDWRLSAVEIDRRVRGYAPWPGAFVDTPKGPLKLEEVVPRGAGGAPGTVVSLHPLTVGCGEGTSVEIVRLRPPGRNSQTGDQYANGARLSVGSELWITT